MQGLTVRHAAPTYVADYEMPSGGDWSLHRGAAVFLDGTCAAAVVSEAVAVAVAVVAVVVLGGASC